jgi:hypothetical protein
VPYYFLAHGAAPCLARAAGGAAAVVLLLQDHQDSCVAVFPPLIFLFIIHCL